MCARVEVAGVAAVVGCMGTCTTVGGGKRENQNVGGGKKGRGKK